MPASEPPASESSEPRAMANTMVAMSMAMGMM